MSFYTRGPSKYTPRKINAASVVCDLPLADLLASYSQQSVATQCLGTSFSVLQFFLPVAQRKEKKKTRLSLLPFSEQSVNPPRPDCAPKRTQGNSDLHPPHLHPSLFHNTFLAHCFALLSPFFYAPLGSSPFVVARWCDLRGPLFFRIPGNLVHLGVPGVPPIWGPRVFGSTPTLGKAQKATRRQREKGDPARSCFLDD